MTRYSNILTIFFSLITLLSFAQDPYVDSLKGKLKTVLHDTTRARIYVDLAGYLSEEDEWVPYNKKALDLANELLPSSSGKIRVALSKIKANAKANYGFYYDNHGQKQKALENYFDALELFDEVGDEEGKAVVYSNLGVILTNQKDFDEAIDYLKKALDLKMKFNRKDIAKNYLNLGVAYENKGDTALGMAYYFKAIDAAKEVDDHIDISTGLNNIGSHYFRNGDYKKAIPYLSSAVTECKIGGDEPGAAWIIANLGMAYLNNGMPDSAAIHLFRAQEIAEAYQYPYLTEAVAEKLYYYYQRQGDWKNAHDQLVIHKKLEDSLKNVSSQKDALRQKMEYDHGLENARLELQREEERKRAAQRTIFISIALVLILIIAIVMYSRYKTTKKQKGVIEIQKQLVEEKNSEITASINYAKHLQRAILPEIQLFFSEFSDGFLTYLPKDIVAGDFYWKSVTKDYIYIAVADSTGHGVPGALVSVVCSNALDKAVNENPQIETGPLLNRTRELVVAQFETEGREVKDGMDIALLRIHKSGEEVLYSGANNPCWLRTTGGWEVLKGSRQPIGKFEYAQPFESIKVPCKKGDWIYLFSDGIIDQFGGEGLKKLKSKGLQDFLSGLDDLSGSERKARLESFFESWKGVEEQIDDVCLIGIKM